MLPLSDTISQSHTHPPVTPNSYFPTCTAHDSQTSSFWKARTGYSNTLGMKTHTHKLIDHTVSGPDHSSLGHQRWGDSPAAMLYQHWKILHRFSWFGRNSSKSLQIVMDITACAAYGGGHDRKVGLQCPAKSEVVRVNVNHPWCAVKITKLKKNATLACHVTDPTAQIYMSVQLLACWGELLLSPI